MIYSIVAPKNGINKLSVQLPASKSISNRVLVLNALSKSPCLIENLSDSDDTKVLIEALEKIEESTQNSDFHLIDVGHAGTSMRFLTAFLAQKEGNWILTGSERMKNRTVKVLVDALIKLGAEITYMEKQGFPPLRIKGKKLNGGSITMDGNISSQFISALIMIAPYLENGLELKLEKTIISKPYIRLTTQLMTEFGADINAVGNTISIASGQYTPIHFSIENDWSAASYWYEIAALSEQGTTIHLPGLRENSLQGDSKIMKLFEPLGVISRFTPKGLEINKQNVSIDSFRYNFIDEPDLAQTFVVSCCLLNIYFSFTGLESLRIKETDRIKALANGMKKVGYLLDTTENEIRWEGKRCSVESVPIISTYNDHRMAMSFAPACLKIKNLQIENPAVVTKSYPAFWKDMDAAGFIIKES